MNRIVNRVTLIQEAKDDHGNWRPIEYINNYIGCGTGVFHEIELHPMEFIEIYVRKYCGSLNTTLRIKLLTQNTVLYSEKYEGYINPTQFDLSLLLKNHPEYYGFIDRTLIQELERISKIQGPRNR